MSLADEVLANHKAFECETLFCSNRPHGICRICAKFWPCESVRLALSLKAAEHVVEAARGHECPETNDSYCDLAAALAEYDKGAKEAQER